MNIYLDLFLTFARIGGLTFGGGYAMLPILQREVVEKRKWASEEELTDYYAIGQCTPGVIAVNVATFIGKKQRGKIGAVIATLGVVFPSFIIISLISNLISTYSDLSLTKHAFSGLRICVCVLIFNSVSKLFSKSIIDNFTKMIFLVVLLLSIFTPVSPIVFIITAGLLGILKKEWCKK